MSESQDNEPDLLPVGGAQLAGVTLAPRDVTPKPNASYAFRMLVPKAFQEATPPGAEREIDVNGRVPLAGWRAPPAEGEHAVAFGVEGMTVPRAISALHLLVHQARVREMELLAYRELGPYFVDALFEKTLHDQSMIARSATWLAGNRQFVATGVAHRSVLERYNPLFGAMIASMQIQDRPEEPFTERRVAHTVLDRVHFQLPVSFAPLTTEQTDTLGLIEFVLKGAGGDLAGLLRVEVEATPARPTDDEIQRAVTPLIARGAVLGSELRELPVGPPVEDREIRRVVWMDASSGAGGVPQEAWVIVARVADLTMRISMMGPGRDDYMFDWAVLQRGHRILLETLQYA